jgi:hypothetical protein
MDMDERMDGWMERGKRREIDGRRRWIGWECGFFSGKETWDGVVAISTSEGTDKGAGAEGETERI